MSSLLQQLEELRPHLGTAGCKVMDYFLENSNTLVDIQISRIADACRTSEATVTRLCKKLGFHGIKEFRVALAQEAGLAGSSDANFLPSDSMQVVFEKIVGGSVRALVDSIDSVCIDAMERAIECILAAYEVNVYGLGGSIAIGSYFRHQLMKVGIRTNLMSDTQSINLSLPQLDSNCVAVAITSSGTTPEIVHAMKWACNQGSRTITITGFTDSPVTEFSEIVIQTKGGIFPYGRSTFSRFSQLAVVNALYAGIALRMDEASLTNIRQKNQEAMKL